jgi:hypothetical protein
MGIVQCKKHGRAGIIELCSHASEIIDSGSFDHFHEIIVLNKLLVCESCFCQYGLARFQGRDFLEAKSDKEAEELLDAYDEATNQLGETDIKCAECVAAAEVNQARKAGRCDPFPVYERTLTSNHRETLRRLEEYLVGNFDFQPSLLEPQEQKRAVFVFAGSYRKPMTVAVYYVTRADKQDLIVKLISEFLADFSLNQSRIVFYEAELTNTSSLTGVTRRGEERILREIFVNC